MDKHNGGPEEPPLEESKAKLGRPSRLDDIADQIVAALRNGADRAAAAEYTGVRYGTFRSWLSRGRDGQEPFAEFLEDVRAAEAEAAVRMAKVVFDAAYQEKDVRAALEWLRRRRPEQWNEPPGGQAQAVAQASIVLVQMDKSMPRAVQELTDDELALLRDQLEGGTES